MTLGGALAHAGSSYEYDTHDALVAIAEQERARTVHAAQRLRAAGLPCDVVSIGSTPTALSAANLDGVTEVRAGVYVMFDLVMHNIGVCALSDIALSVLTTVIGHQEEKGWAIVDAGWMAMSRDRGTQRQARDFGYGQVCTEAGDALDGYLMSSANQEHGIVSRSGTPDRISRSGFRSAPACGFCRTTRARPVRNIGIPCADARRRDADLAAFLRVVKRRPLRPSRFNVEAPVCSTTVASSNSTVHHLSTGSPAMPSDAQLLLLDRDAVGPALQAEQVTAAVRDAFLLHSRRAGRVFPVVREKLHTGGIFGIKSGDVAQQELLGFKAAGFWPGNRSRGGEPHQATIALFDPATGRPLCIMDGNAITTARRPGRSGCRRWRVPTARASAYSAPACRRAPSSTGRSRCCRSDARCNT
jgi:hypothetical protein